MWRSKKNIWRRPWSFRIFPPAFICQTQAPRVSIVKDDFWPKVCFDLRRIPSIIILYHDATTLIISVISISTTKTLSTLARQVQVLPIDKARLGNSEGIGDERQIKYARCFFHLNMCDGTEVAEFCFFSWLFEISDVYFQPVPRNLVGLKGVIPGTLHGRNAMGRKNVRRRRHRVLVKFVQCKAEIAPPLGKRFWMRWMRSCKEL